MLVLSLAVSGTGNCATVAGTPYVYARTELGSVVLPARCPHRGGPLHLAAFEPGRARLVCPWHERATSVSKSLKAGIPAVRRGEVVTVVLPHDEDAAYQVNHLPLSAELSRA